MGSNQLPRHRHLVPFEMPSGIWSCHTRLTETQPHMHWGGGWGIWRFLEQSEALGMDQTPTVEFLKEFISAEFTYCPHAFMKWYLGSPCFLFVTVHLEEQCHFQFIFSFSHETNLSLGSPPGKSSFLGMTRKQTNVSITDLKIAYWRKWRRNSNS